MPDPAPATPASGAPADSGAQQPETPKPNVVPPATKQQDSSSNSIDAFPEDAQKLIRDLRQESQRYRQGSEQAAKDAAEQAKKDLAQAIGKALGLVDDDNVDPAKLTEQAQQAQAAQREAARELAVYKAAAGAGADPARLLDSRSFLASIDGLDPTDGDKITAAIKNAVQNNPTLSAAPAAGASTVDHAGGSGEGPQPKGKPQKTMADAVANYYASR